ncbi:TPA: amidohydrolase, partial [Escherichia coli]|nr:amidohydrolase [Escherichia coli]
MTLQEFIDRNFSRYTSLRRDLHRHPETGFEEIRTSNLIADLLKSWGYEVNHGMAKTGIVGT